MKNHITIITLFILSLNCKAQYNNIVPLENYYSYLENNNINDGTYLKDVNNILNKFITVKFHKVVTQQVLILDKTFIYINE